MSARAKMKRKDANHRSEYEVDAGAVAAVSSPVAPIVVAEGSEAASEAALAKTPLIVRVKEASESAVVRSFASLRAFQERMRGWAIALDAAMVRSLTAGEQFLLARLAQTPSPSSAAPATVTVAVAPETAAATA